MKTRPIIFSAPMIRAILAGSKTQTRRVVKPQPTHIEWFAHQKGWIGSFGDDAGTSANPHRMVPCPYGQPGDGLWCREAWIDTGARAAYEFGKSEFSQFVTYVADGTERTIPVTEDIFRGWLDKGIERQRKRCPPDPTDESAPDYWERFYARNDWLTHQYKVHRSPLFMPLWARRPELDRIITNIRVERLGDISEADARAEGIEKDAAEWRNYKPAKVEPFPWFKSPIDSYQSLWTSIHGPGSWERDRDKWVWVLEFKKGN